MNTERDFAKTPPLFKPMEVACRSISPTTLWNSPFSTDRSPVKVPDVIGRPLEILRGPLTGLPIPANAEIVLEGYVQLGEMRIEGPFGDHTGFYSRADEYPVFHVMCITQRKEPVYATTIVGPPPMEDFYMGDASVRIFLPFTSSTIEPRYAAR